MAFLPANNTIVVIGYERLVNGCNTIKFKSTWNEPSEQFIIESLKQLNDFILTRSRPNVFNIDCMIVGVIL